MAFTALSSVAPLDRARRRMGLELHKSFSTAGAPDWIGPLSSQAPLPTSGACLPTLRGRGSATPAWRERVPSSPPLHTGMQRPH